MTKICPVILFINISVMTPNLPIIHVPRLHICEGDGGGAGHCLWTGGVQPGKHDGVEEDRWLSLQFEATERAEFIFSLLDTNGDGEISEEEFIKGCLEDQELVTLLQP